VLIEIAQLLDQFLIAESVGPGAHDPLGGIEHLGRDDGLERAFLLDPHVGRVGDPMLLELEGDPVVDVVADVLLVTQHLAHRGPCPLPAQVGQNTFAVETGCNLGFRNTLIDEPTVDLVHDLDLRVGARHQDDSVGLQAFVLTASQLAFHGACLVDQHPAQPITGGATLAVAQFDQPALAGEHLGRQFPAVFTGHRPFDALDDGGHRRAVVLELLGAVGNLDAGAAADVLVVGALVGVLETPPAADVVDQDDLEVRLARLDLLDQPLQGQSSIDAQTALALVGIGPDDLDATSGGVLSNLVALILGRVLLMLGGHAHILSGAKEGCLDCVRVARFFCLHCRDCPLTNGFQALGDRASRRASICERRAWMGYRGSGAGFRECLATTLTGERRRAYHVFTLQSAPESSQLTDMTVISTIHTSSFAIPSAAM